MPVNVSCNEFANRVYPWLKNYSTSFASSGVAAVFACLLRFEESCIVAA